MPSKCQSCWNYGKSIMYCIFKCRKDEKVKEKTCNTCKHREIESGCYPCNKCSEIFVNAIYKNMWEKKGCEFCRGEIKILADDEWEFARQQTFVLRMEGYDFVVSDMNSNDKLYSVFQYCPLCGTKL